jgi:hypothetical protein
VEYYTRIERGNLSGVSDNVIEAIVGAPRLDDAERAPPFDLARANQPAASTRRRRATRQQVRPNVQWVLDSITGAAAFVSNGSHDILAANQLGKALWSPLYLDLALTVPRPGLAGARKRPPEQGECVFLTLAFYCQEDHPYGAA